MHVLAVSLLVRLGLGGCLTPGVGLPVDLLPVPARKLDMNEQIWTKRRLACPSSISSLSRLSHRHVAGRQMT